MEPVRAQPTNKEEEAEEAWQSATFWVGLPGPHGLPGSWVVRKGIAVLIGVGATPSGKNVFMKARLIPETAREFRLVRAPHGTIVPPNLELSVQLESVPLGTGLSRTQKSSWSRLLTEPDYHGQKPSWSHRTTVGKVPAGASSSQSRTLADCPSGVGSQGDWTTMDKHSGHGSSECLLSWSRFPWGPDCHEPGFRPWGFLLREGSFFYSEALGRAGAGSGSLTTADSWTGAGSQSLTTADSRAGVGSQSLTTADSRAGVGSQSLTVREPFSAGNQMSSDKSWATGSETSPGDPSASGVEVTVVHRRTGLPRTNLMASQGGDRSFRWRSDAVWFHNCSSWQSWHDRHGLISEPDARYDWGQLMAGTEQADMMRVVSMATHTVGGTGSQSTQFTSPSQPPV